MSEAFESAWALLKALTDPIRRKMEKVLTPEQMRSIAQMNYDLTRDNPMVWDYDMTAMFPRECSVEGQEGIRGRYCPHGSTITSFVTGRPLDDKHGICSICENPSIQELYDESVRAKSSLGLPPEAFKEMLEGVKRGDEPDESSVNFDSIGDIDYRLYLDNMEGYE